MTGGGEVEVGSGGPSDQTSAGHTVPDKLGSEMTSNTPGRMSPTLSMGVEGFSGTVGGPGSVTPPTLSTGGEEFAGSGRGFGSGIGSVSDTPASDGTAFEVSSISERQNCFHCLHCSGLAVTLSTPVSTASGPLPWPQSLLPPLWPVSSWSTTSRCTSVSPVAPSL
jgi:hypothetical protein